MNCLELALVLDERDLERLPAAERSVAAVHLAGCPACARDHDLHRRLNELPIPPLSTERIAGWRAMVLSRAGTGHRLRSRLVIIGALVALAAAAALLGVILTAVPAQPVAEVKSIQRPIVVADPAASPDNAVGNTTSAVAAQTRSGRESSAPIASGAFTVLVLPLQIDSANPAARTLGEDFYSRLLDRLREIPDLVLQQPGSKQIAVDGPADFRLKVSSGYGKVPERFGGHEQWIQSLGVEVRNKVSNTYAQGLGISINPECGRISPVDLAGISMCTPAGMVEIDIQQLRRSVFPPDSSVTRQLQVRFLDKSLPQGERRQALAELIEFRQRAPGAMDPELIRVIIQDAIANAPYPAQRVTLWQALRGQSGAHVIEPLIANLRWESDDSVRLEMVGILAAEFSADPVAHAELELIAKRDAKLLVRMVAERALSGDAAWRAYVVATVRDASLPAATRFEPLQWMADAALARTNARTDAELVSVAQQLFNDGDAVALAEVLTAASKGPAWSVAGLLQIRMSAIQNPAVADFLIATVDRQPDFPVFSLLGRHRADPRIEAKLKDMATNYPDANVRQLAAAQLINK